MIGRDVKYIRHIIRPTAALIAARNSVEQPNKPWDKPLGGCYLGADRASFRYVLRYQYIYIYLASEQCPVMSCADAPPYLFPVPKSGVSLSL